MSKFVFTLRQKGAGFGLPPKQLFFDMESWRGKWIYECIPPLFSFRKLGDGPIIPLLPFSLFNFHFFLFISFPRVKRGKGLKPLGRLGNGGVRVCFLHGKIRYECIKNERREAELYVNQMENA